MRADQSVSASPTPPERSVTIAICTFKRAAGLIAAVNSIIESHQLTTGWRLAEILVVDNDPAGSGEATLQAVEHPLVRYVHEPRSGVTFARNAAIDHAVGDVLCFIDDDEIVAESWPGGLLAVMSTTGAALVGGPVQTSFTSEPPQWILDGRFFERVDPAHNESVVWLRTGNLAIDLDLVRVSGLRFDDAFNQSGGEDVAFSRSARAAGLDLRWSTSGSVTELVPPERATEAWLIRRERVSAANYVRALRSRSSLTTVLASVAPRLVVRFFGGMASLLLATVTRSKPAAVKARLSIERARGTIDGLRGIASDSYGSHA